MSNTIRLATTDAEKQAIYRHRYEIYMLELNKSHIAADHNQHTLDDDADSCADLFYLQSGEEVIGSSRVQKGRSLLFLPCNNEIYETEAMARAIDVQTIAIVDRLMVAPEHRKSRITPELIINTYVFGLNSGIKLALINTEEKYLHLYTRFGFRVYGNPYFTPTGERRYRMALFLCDREHLVKVNSPLVSYLPESLDDKGAYLAKVRRTLGPCFVKCFHGFDNPLGACCKQIHSFTPKALAV